MNLYRLLSRSNDIRAALKGRLPQRIVRKAIYHRSFSVAAWLCRLMGLCMLLSLAPSTASAQPLDWPSIVAAAAGQIGDATTTARFLSRGTCTETNTNFQASDHQLAKIWASKFALVGALVVVNHIAERWKNSDERTLLKLTSRSLNYVTSAVGMNSTIHNVRHCSI